MKTHFLLARHGETQWNLIKKLQGQLDSPLTPIGYRQAENLALLLVDAKVNAIVSSPLPARAANSAAYTKPQSQRSPS